MAAAVLSVLGCKFINFHKAVSVGIRRTTNTSMLQSRSSLLSLCGASYRSSYRFSSGYSQGFDAEPDKLYKTVEIEVKGHDPTVINSYEKFVRMAARELDVTIGKVWSPPKPKLIRWTLLKSAHIYAKHKVQYETRTHFRTIEMKHLTGSTADTILEYIERNLPEGMAMKVTRHAIEAISDHLKPPVEQTVTSPVIGAKSEPVTSNQQLPQHQNDIAQL